MYCWRLGKKIWNNCTCSLLEIWFYLWLRSFFFFFFFFLFSLTSLSRLFHSYRDEPINRWGETGVPRENHLTHPQAELDLSHMWPVWGSNPHQKQRWDDRMIKDDNEISHLNHSATGAALDWEVSQDKLQLKRCGCRRSWSKVWQYFTIQNIKGIQTAISHPWIHTARYHPWICIRKTFFPLVLNQTLFRTFFRCDIHATSLLLVLAFQRKKKKILKLFFPILIDFKINVFEILLWMIDLKKYFLMCLQIS